MMDGHHVDMIAGKIRWLRFLRSIGAQGTEALDKERGMEIANPYHHPIIRQLLGLGTVLP